MSVNPYGQLAFKEKFSQWPTNHVFTANIGREVTEDIFDRFSFKSYLPRVRLESPV